MSDWLVHVARVAFIAIAIAAVAVPEAASWAAVGVLVLLMVEQGASS